MGKVIDGSSIFTNANTPSCNNEIYSLQQKIEYYRNFLLLYEGIESPLNYYLVFHEGLYFEEEFVDIKCPHCHGEINENTMSNQKVWVHSKQDSQKELDNRESWGILELICPHCKNKVVVILE